LALNIHLDDFLYELPDEAIAKYPLADRSESRLLVFAPPRISSYLFSELPGFYGQDDLIILNNTRVIPARFHFTKSTGARIEILLIEPNQPTDYSLAFSSKSSVTWVCVIGNAKKWRSGVLEIALTNPDITLSVKQIEKVSDKYLISFSWNNPNLTFAEVLKLFGEVPIPPYLNRHSEDIDKTRYQTVYARADGSVAAPTAGLHFDERIMNNLVARGCNLSELTLHVGAGTFTPIKSSNIEDHVMHIESISVNRLLLTSLLDSKRSITAVGTTTLRSLESLYWIGIMILDGKTPGPDGWFVDQWHPYQHPCEVHWRDSLKAILNYLVLHNNDQFEFKTGLMILPGYQFRIPDRLITNFHQPGSTLLLLVAAWTGQSWKKIYQFALSNGFRFLSYGDGSLLFKPEQ